MAWPDPGPPAGWRRPGAGGPDTRRSPPARLRACEPIGRLDPRGGPGEEHRSPPARLSRRAMRLAGKTAVVTGATRGIGRAIALTLASEGADVLVHGRDADAGRGVVAAIEGLGRRA